MIRKGKITWSRCCASALIVLMLAAGAPALRAQTSTSAPQKNVAPLAVQPTVLPLNTVAPLQSGRPLAHEQSPVEWPVADYFAQALQLTDMRPGVRVSALKLLTPMDQRASYLTLPVQTQAFGFSPAFRALAGAMLDLQLEAAGIETNKQTDVVDAYGPFVRRFDVAHLDNFAAANPKSKLIGMYIGHDGISQMFLTLVVGNGQNLRKAHRTLALPADAQSAQGPITMALAAMIKEAGLPLRSPPPQPLREARACKSDVWTWAPPARNASRGTRACHAVAVGTLLPLYDAQDVTREVSEAQSPARLAWLAQAYVLAAPDELAPRSAAAIRDLASRQLGLTHSTAPMLPVNDPVVDRILQLSRLRTNTEQSPIRSAQKARAQELARITEGLPRFATAVFRAKLDFTEPFNQLDLCAVERLLPQTTPRAICGEERTQPPPRVAWPEETLLYQEWRLATYFKELAVAGITQGSRPRTNEALARWPTDVAEHPYLQRLHQTIEHKLSSTGSFDEQLIAARKTAQAVTQNTVDLQRADHWLAGYSLNGHGGWGNTNIKNDAQVRKASQQELRLLSVLRFDKFALDHYLAQRKAGDTAFFLAPQNVLEFASGGMPPRLMILADAPKAGASAPAAPPWPLFTPRLFPPTSISQVSTDEELLAEIRRNPTNMSARREMAIGRLQDGGSLADALKLIDAQPTDQRQDNRVTQSHAWAEPAHVFWFAGELEPAWRYYAKTANIGTGSESEMMARIRLNLLDGNLRGALEATARRSERYNSDYASRDQAAMLFAFGERNKAWQVFLERAATTRLFSLWFSAYVGHRMEMMESDRIEAWLSDKKLDKAQINFTDSGRLYLHLYTVMDRLPEEADIQRLKRPRAPQPYVSPLWGASAELARSALLGADSGRAYQAAAAAMKGTHNPSLSFMQPLYTWASWHATDGKDPYLNEVRDVTTRSTFDEVLAKSMLLALEGKSGESLRYFTAARYEIASTSERLMPASYSLAVAGLLMHRKTGQDAYRLETLKFVRAQQKVFPYYGWLYGMEALLETNGSRRHTAACLTQYLDARSYFLSQAKVGNLDASKCREVVAAVLQ